MKFPKLPKFKLPTSEYIFFHIPVAILLLGLAYILVPPAFTFEVNGKLDALVFPFVVCYTLLGVVFGLSGFFLLTQNLLVGTVDSYVRNEIRRKISNELSKAQGDPTSPPVDIERRVDEIFNDAMCSFDQSPKANPGRASRPLVDDADLELNDGLEGLL